MRSGHKSYFPRSAAKSCNQKLEEKEKIGEAVQQMNFELVQLEEGNSQKVMLLKLKNINYSRSC